MKFGVLDVSEDSCPVCDSSGKIRFTVRLGLLSAGGGSVGIPFRDGVEPGEGLTG